MKYIYLLAFIFAFSCSSPKTEEVHPYSLDGVDMTYQYTGGNAYHVKFENGNVSYQFLTGSKPKTWWGPFPYQATQTENGEYFLTWYEEGYGDIVTLLLNPEQMTIWGSALIAKKDKNIVHFQKAKLSELKR